VGGVASEIDGSFKLDINSPATRLEVSVIGYSTVKLSSVEPSKFYTIKLQEATNELSEVVVMYEAPLIDRSSSAKVFSADDLGYSAAQGRVNVRGSRAEGTVQFIDGVKMRSSVAGFQISQNPVNLKFEVDIPYDIPSDGEEYKVAIAKFEKEVDYLYKAVPKLNEHAFLTASLTDWEELNLMNGGAGIYLEGTYLGETYLNVEEAGDTLQVSLGKDENIVVQRNSVKQKEGSRLLSGKKEERFHYEIKVRNNKGAALKLEITDQFPVSGNDDITVSRIESTEGKVDDKSGIITWEFILQTKEEKNINLIYTIRYPKGRTVNLR
jgi:uncharacterized protein (TIGR02231 family)